MGGEGAGLSGAHGKDTRTCAFVCGVDCAYEDIRRAERNGGLSEALCPDQWWPVKNSPSGPV